MGNWLFLLLISTQALALDSSVDVDRKVFHTRALAISATSFEELSAHLYGGDVSFAPLLRELNASPSGGPGGVVKYPKPRYRITRGDTFQRVGAFWAGGSAFSYKLLLEVNPQIRNPNSVEPGTWIYLPRIPSTEEQARWKDYWYANNEPGAKPVATAAETPKTAPIEVEALSTEPLPVVNYSRSPYDPKTDAERVALVEWYLDRPELKKDRARSDALVQDLVAKSEKFWKARYVAGQYFLSTGRPAQAAEHFSECLEDSGAPIQAGLYFLKARELSKYPVGTGERDSLHKRYPQLRSLLAEMK